MKSREFASGDAHIRYVDDQGSGEPVVLVHGFSGSAEMWDGVTPLLAGRFRVIALDCRGHGASSEPHDTNAYGSEMVADVARLLDELTIDAAHVVGYSMGAEIALNFTTRWPERVRSLCMGGSGWSGPDDAANYMHGADVVAEGGSVGPLIHAMQPDGAPPPSDEEIAVIDALLKDNDLKALAAVARAMHEIINLPREAVAGVALPVLGISGEHDPERGNLERMAGVVPNFTMKVLDGVDHMGAVADPRLGTYIRGFLLERVAR